MHSILRRKLLAAESENKELQQQIEELKQRGQEATLDLTVEQHFEMLLKLLKDEPAAIAVADMDGFINRLKQARTTRAKQAGLDSAPAEPAPVKSQGQKQIPKGLAAPS